MPEFILDTSGKATTLGPFGKPYAVKWRDLDWFTQGYIEALFFTENAPGVSTEEWQATEEHVEGTIPDDVGFSDLAPETIAEIIEDCRKFQAQCATALEEAQEVPGWGEGEERGPRGDDTWDGMAGRDFWYTRNGHGCGFWDGDWPEPYASTLTAACKGFGEVDAYLGDDGKVYLS